MVDSKNNHVLLFPLIIFLTLTSYLSQSAIIVTTQSTSPTPSIPSSSTFLSFSTSTTISQNSTFSQTTKCFGNFIQIGFKCVSCQKDQIAQSNRCVKLLGWGYGTNLIQSTSHQNINSNLNNNNNNLNNQNNLLPSSSTLTLINCNKTSLINGSICIQCNIYYDLIDGRCVQQSCKIYSQVVGKCLDDLKNYQIQTLTNKTHQNIQNIQNNIDKNQRPISAQQIYIIGGPMSKMQIMLIDNIISLTLPTQSIKIPDKQLKLQNITIQTNKIQPPAPLQSQLLTQLQQQLQLQLQDISNNNNNNNNINNINNISNISNISNNNNNKNIKDNPIVPGCLIYQIDIPYICKQCQQGYILNILINQCKIITSAIILPNIVTDTTVDNSMNNSNSTNNL